MSSKAEAFRRRAIWTLSQGEQLLWQLAIDAFNHETAMDATVEEALAACDKVITEGLPEAEAHDKRIEEWFRGDHPDRKGTVASDDDGEAE